MTDLLFQMPLGVQLANVLDGQLLRGHFLLLFQSLNKVNMNYFCYRYHSFSIWIIQKTNNHTAFLNKVCRSGSDRIRDPFSVEKPKPQEPQLFALAEPERIPVPEPNLNPDQT